MTTAPALGIAILLTSAVSPAVAATPSEAPSGQASELSRGQEIGSVFEAFLSPDQEPGEEQDTPAATPKQFKSTAPSLLREPDLITWAIRRALKLDSGTPVR